MTAIPQAMCTAPGCTARVRKGRCSAHQTKHVDAFADVYRSRAWRALVKQVKREEPYCRMQCGRPTTEVDHILAMHDGGAPLARENLQGLCGICHDAKTRRDRRARRGRKKHDDGV